ncbi:Diadenosine tetraphosphate (Ap4A) hydrolase and other HIT family hydrolases [hydrothermal vent metagenome]|uniref:Diadenosine tetraphosphate (Ap4A) hydrolase and other HIT family hydrolases n=1 Tax=hydrothermal vent metagenome TaxID=652676 RepID=A0A1W1C0Q1_9ZZZZ
MIIFQNKHFYIEVEPSTLPWLKIFTQTPYKELTDMPKELRDQLWEIYYIIEEVMRDYFQPDKINMASFANMLPRVHIHVIARFKDDAYFPNPVWGERLRDDKVIKKDFELFYKEVAKRVERVK